MDNFITQLRMQLTFLKNSCALYDSGEIDEAIRIATTIRVLIHQTKISTSLLQHLNATKIWLYSTAIPDISNSLYDSGLGFITINFNSDGTTTTKNTPFLDQSFDHDYYISVEDWWNQRISRSSLSTRKSIVLEATNKDGGAHVDTKLSEEYRSLKKSLVLIQSCNEAGEITNEGVPNSHLVALRQMAYELLNSNELTKLAFPKPPDHDFRKRYRKLLYKFVLIP